MEAYRKELEQADAAVQNVRRLLVDLHQSSEHPDDLTTAEELRQQIKALQGPIIALDSKVEQTRTLMMETWNDSIAYMQASKAQHEDLDHQILELWKLVDTLVVLEAQYRRSISDHSPEAKRIIEAANGRDVPPLPRLPGQ
jgi:hypothetical protein